MGKDLKGKELGKGLSQRTNGRYNARAIVNGEKIDITDTSLAELKRKFEEAKMHAMTKSLANMRFEPTLNEWFAEFFETYKSSCLKNDGKPYVRMFNNYFGNRLGERKISSILQMDVQRVIAELLDEGRTSKSIREAVGILRQCYEIAQANGICRTNPAIGVLIPENAPVHQRVLTAEEQEEFLDYLTLKNHWFKEMFEFMLLTGMRISEVAGLQYSDISFTEGMIYVRRQLKCDYDGGADGHEKTLKLDTCKTTNSEREIPFIENVVEIIERWREKVEARKEELGNRWRLLNNPELGDLVFVTSMGSPVSRHAAEHALRRITEDINALRLFDAQAKGEPYIPMENINPHALRHTFATRCLESEYSSPNGESRISLRTLQGLLGHASPQTLAMYTHSLPAQKKKECSRLVYVLHPKKGAPENKE